jgi:hypothetical protein
MKLQLKQFSLRIVFAVFVVMSVLLANWQFQSRRPIVVQVCGNGIVVIDGIGMRDAEMDVALNQLLQARARWMLDTIIVMKIDLNVGYNDVSNALNYTHASGIEKYHLEPGSKYTLLDISDIELPTEHKVVSIPIDK